VRKAIHRGDHERRATTIWRGILYTAPICIGLLSTAPAAGQWPIREFEVVSSEAALGSTLPNIFNSASEQVDEWLVAWGLEPTGARLYVADPEIRREIEAYLTEAADVIAGWGFPPPALAESDGKYEVILAVETPAGLKGETAGGTYHGPICGIIGGQIFISANSILGAPTEEGGRPELTAFGRVTLAHELFHAVQANTAFHGSPCLPSMGEWIVEGTADAVGVDVLRILRGEEVADQAMAWGERDYGRRLPVPLDLSILPREWTPERLAGYRTSSFWRYLAEYYAMLGSGERPGPAPAGDRIDYGYLATMFGRGEATGCVGADASCDYELRWLDAGLKSIFGSDLAELYPLFAETLVLYGEHRVPPVANAAIRWRDAVFGDCVYFDLTPGRRMHRLVIDSFEPVSMDCWTVVPTGGFEQDVFVKVTVHGPPGGFSLADLAAAVAGQPVKVEPQYKETAPDKRSVSWTVKLAHDQENHVVLTNVAEDPAASTRMTNLPISFEVLEPAAIVSFGASVSGQDPFDLNSSEMGAYEVPVERLRFGVQGVRTDVAACLVGLNLPTEEGDLVVLAGSLPLPLEVGEFPIEPPDFSRSSSGRRGSPPPRPAVSVEGQVFRSCAAGGCGDSQGAPWRTNAYRGTLRISAITRSQIAGGFDMVAVDEPVRASGSFVAPLGGPAGLSARHPCAPVESNIESPSPPANGDGSAAGPQASAGTEHGMTARAS